MAVEIRRTDIVIRGLTSGDIFSIPAICGPLSWDMHIKCRPRPSLGFLERCPEDDGGALPRPALGLLGSRERVLPLAEVARLDDDLHFECLTPFVMKHSIDPRHRHLVCEVERY